MTTLDEALTAIRGRTEGLVPGPWTWSVGAVEALDYDGNPAILFEREGRHITTRNDVAFIAHARTDVPLLLAALDAVVERAEWTIQTHEEPVQSIFSMGLVYEARGTLQAITTALAGGAK